MNYMSGGKQYIPVDTIYGTMGLQKLQIMKLKLLFLMDLWFILEHFYDNYIATTHYI